LSLVEQTSRSKLPESLQPEPQNHSNAAEFTAAAQLGYTCLASTVGWWHATA
jgi:hypothetical protein